MAADGSGVVKMTNHPAIDARAAYSPDGNWLVFNSERESSGQPKIFRISTTGGAAGADQNVWFYRTWATSPDWGPFDSCTIRGTIFDDRIDVYETSRGPETFCGLAGNDYIDGGPGDDVIRGGPGNDRLIANDRDRDRVFGDAGNDRIDVREWQGRPTRDVVNGGPGRDYALADRIDRLRGVERVDLPRRRS